MKVVTISALVTEVTTLALNGAGSVTVSLAVASDTVERMVLTAVGFLPTKIERSLRDTQRRQAEQYLATFKAAPLSPAATL